MSKSIEAFLAPLAKLAVRHPDVEAAVIWGDASGWDAQDDDLEMLDAEEITFYAEGLLAEGFSMTWQVVAAAHTPTDPDLVLLFFWQGTAPALPVSSDAALVLDAGTWTADQSMMMFDKNIIML